MSLSYIWENGLDQVKKLNGASFALTMFSWNVVLDAAQR